MKKLLTFLLIAFCFTANAQVQRIIGDSTAIGVKPGAKINLQGVVNTTYPIKGVPAVNLNELTTKGQVDSIQAVIVSGLPNKEFNKDLPSKTITSDGFYNSFPGICKKNGKIYLVYRKGTSHISNNSDIILKTSLDSGKTWSSESTILNIPDRDVRDPSITALANGDLIVSYFKYYNPTQSADPYTMKSTDNGVTWGAPVPLTGYTVSAAVSSPVIQLPNGDLLLSIYTNDGTTFPIKVYKSTNNGDSWSYLSTVVTTTTWAYTEPALVRLSNGDIFITFRDESNLTVVKAKSTDNGATWNTPVTTFTSKSRALLTEYKENILVNTRSSDGYPQLRYSSDNGSTFSEGTLTIKKGFTAGDEYSSLVNITDNVFGFVYSLQEKEGGTVADIFFKYVEFPKSFDISPTINVDGVVSKSGAIIDGDVYLSGRLYSDSTTFTQDLYVSGESGLILNKGVAFDIQTDASGLKINETGAGNRLTINKTTGNSIFSGTVKASNATMSDELITLGQVSSLLADTVINHNVVIRNPTKNPTLTIDDSGVASTKLYMEKGESNFVVSLNNQKQLFLSYNGNVNVGFGSEQFRKFSVNGDGYFADSLQAPLFVGDLKGNAYSSSRFATPVMIAGVPFDGTGDVSLNNNSIINGAGYITSAAASLGFTPYNPASYPVNAGGETFGSVMQRGSEFYKDNFDVRFARSSGLYGFRIKQDNSNGNIHFQTVLSDGTTPQTFMNFGEGESSSNAVLYLQPGNESNVHVGYSSNQGYKLAVNGTGYFAGNVTASTPTDSNHLATKAYVDNAVSTSFVSGIYNPTVTGDTYVSSAIIPNNSTHYMRVGNQVTVTGTVSVTATGTGVGCIVTVTLPVASDLASGYDVTGVAYAITPSTFDTVRIDYDATSDKAQILFNSNAGLSGNIAYSYMYTVK